MTLRRRSPRPPTDTRITFRRRRSTADEIGAETRRRRRTTRTTYNNQHRLVAWSTAWSTVDGGGEWADLARGCTRTFRRAPLPKWGTPRSRPTWADCFPPRGVRCGIQGRTCPHRPTLHVAPTSEPTTDAQSRVPAAISVKSPWSRGGGGVEQ